MAAHATSVDTNQLAAALATFRDLSWPVTAAGVAPLINTLGWSATDDDHKIFDANTGWPINRPEATFSLHENGLTSVSFRLSDVLLEDTAERDDFLTDSFATAVSTATTALGAPSSRSKGAEPQAYWELASGGRITISRIVSSVTCRVHSAEYAAAMRTLSRHG